MGNRRQLGVVPSSVFRGHESLTYQDQTGSSDCDSLESASLDELAGLDGPWTEINAEDVAVQTSYVSESMYLVLEDPSSKLLTGEKIIAKAHALGSHLESCGDLRSATPGTLFLTNHRILFAAFGNTTGGLYSPANRLSVPPDRPDFSIDVPLCSIASVRGCSGQDVDTIISIMEVTTKNFFRLRFGFPYDCSSSEVFQRLRKLRQRDSSVFAFQATTPTFIPDRPGWRCYDPVVEYQRQGLISPSASQSSMRPIGNAGAPLWRLTSANEDYSLCPTYPRVFVVPAAISDDDLREIAKFRINSRLPAVTYLHRQTGATISRCSQPLVGLRRARNAKDEALFLALKEATKSQKLCIMDCRNQTSAFANLAMGAGFESSANYGNADVIFMGIENIHSVRDSYKRVFDLLQKPQEGQQQWLSNLESTRWLEHLRSLLMATARSVELVAFDGVSIVCHCSDGWDRTTQVSCLAKMMMDPFYRTLRGFQVLIEQEWCSFGHRFADRYGVVDRPVNFWEDEDCSPVFAQFLDAVWQLMQQFPCAFEFNSRYLIALMDAMMSGRCGTFFGNCEQDRVKSGAASKTLSVWTLIHHDRKQQQQDILNPYYAKPGSPNDYGGVLPRVLHPDCHPANINLWVEFYLRQKFSEADLDGRQKKALDLRRKCNALAGAKATLQMQLKRTKEQLEEEKNEKQTLMQELQKLQVEKKNLRKALEGQVYGDANGVLVQEDEDEDSVLVTMSTDPTQDPTEQLRRQSLVARQASFARKPALRFSAVGFQMLKSYFAVDSDEVETALDSSECFSRLSLDTEQ